MIHRWSGYGEDAQMRELRGLIAAELERAGVDDPAGEHPGSSGHTAADHSSHPATS